MGSSLDVTLMLKGLTATGAGDTAQSHVGQWPEVFNHLVFSIVYLFSGWLVCAPVGLKGGYH